MPIRKSNDTLFYLIGIIPVVWLALLLAQSLDGGLPELLRNLTSALEQPTNIVWTDKSLPTILICLAAYGMAVLLYRTNQGRTRDGEEHGSASWGSVRELDKKYRDKDAGKNVILTQHLQMSMNGKLHRRNLLQIIVGGSGSGKTRFLAKPNLMLANASFICTDPKLSLIHI